MSTSCLCLLSGDAAVDRDLLASLQISEPGAGLHLLMIVPRRDAPSIEYLQNMTRQYGAVSGELLLFTEGATIFSQWDTETLPRNDNWLYDTPHAVVSLVSLAIARLEALGYRRLFLPLRREGLDHVTENIGNFLYCLNRLADEGTSSDMHPVLQYPLMRERPICPDGKTVLNYHQATTPDQKAVVLFSGGLDCTVAAYVMRKLGHSLHLYNVQYGQSNRYQEQYCIEKTVEDLSNGGIAVLTCLSAPIFQSVGGSALLDDTVMITQNNTSDEYVPFRNTILINFAVHYALKKGIPYIVTGAHRDDTLAPDNRYDYYLAFQQLLQCQKATSHIHLLPILLWIGGKPEITWVGNQLGVDFRYCWSCHNYIDKQQAGDKAAACGLCGNCTTRYHAFIQAGLEDPLLYKVKPVCRQSWYGWSPGSEEMLALLDLSPP